MDESARERGANFSADEIAVLTELVKNDIDDMFERFSPTNTAQDKERLLKEFTIAVSALGVAPRSVKDLKTKWKTLKCGAKQAFQTVKKTRQKTRGGQCSTKLKAGESEIIDILGETASFSGIKGGFTSCSTPTFSRSLIREDDESSIRSKDRVKGR